jgi:hypothetical protein
MDLPILRGLAASNLDAHRPLANVCLWKGMTIYTVRWWARQDSNLQPDRYERPALTIELRALPWKDCENRGLGTPGGFGNPACIR